jgi:hypothetical protein
VTPIQVAPIYVPPLETAPIPVAPDPSGEPARQEFPPNKGAPEHWPEGQEKLYLACTTCHNATVAAGTPGRFSTREQLEERIRLENSRGAGIEEAEIAPLIDELMKFRKFK